MPAADGTVWISLDFDGTCVEPGDPLRWRPRAKEFILGAAAAGVRIWLFSCRCAPACGLPEASAWEADDFWRSGRVPEWLEVSWRLYEEMRAFLEAEGVWGLMTPWTLPGKPLCDAFIDDKAEAPDFHRLAAELGVHLAPAYPLGVSSPHAVTGTAPADARVGSIAVPAGPGAGGAPGSPDPVPAP